MANGRLEFTIGTISFAGEGETEWVVGQLNAFIGRIPELTSFPDQSGRETAGNQPSSENAKSLSLVSFLRSTSSTDNQTRKFLATAEWLRLRGNARATTSSVANALKENSQKGLGNASDCLNKNVAKGFCEKVGSEFFVTDEGRTSLGIT